MSLISGYVNDRIHEVNNASHAFDFARVDKQTQRAARDDARFINKQIQMLPFKLQKLVLRNASKKSGGIERNVYVRTTVKSIVDSFPPALRQTSIEDDDDIMRIAEKCAMRASRICSREAQNRTRAFTPQSNTQQSNTQQSNTQQSINALARKEMPKKSPVNKQSRIEALTDKGDLMRERMLYAAQPFLESYGLEIPYEGVTLQGAIRRVCEKAWWKRKLSKIIKQAFETCFIRLGQVSKHKEIYASNFTTRNRQLQKIRNDNLLSSMYVTNDIGQQYSLKELSDLNVSNPKIRKAELMVRMRGFEEIANERGDQGLFVTITCPSKYHAVYAKSGQANPKYQGFTPFQGNQYLGVLFAKIRAAWQKKDLAPYGFRVAEPQHDGTPHWHILLFINPTTIEQVKTIIRHYALLEDSDEQGAQDNRCDFKLIDSTKGSATGYIAKYVSKNIDGEGLDKGAYGEDPISAAQRVDAWASCWCIRQFQQFGGASVSIYRELRRLRKSLAKDSVLEKARKAADESNWAAYIHALGGLNLKRKDRPVSLAYEPAFNEETGECKIGYFDEEVIQKLKGLVYQGRTYITRFYNWTVTRAAQKSFNLEYCK